MFLTCLKGNASWSLQGIYHQRSQNVQPLQSFMLYRGLSVYFRCNCNLRPMLERGKITPNDRIFHNRELLPANGSSQALALDSSPSISEIILYYRSLAPLTKAHWISNPCSHSVTLKQTSFLSYFAVSDHVPDQYKDLLSFWVNIEVYKRG